MQYSYSRVECFNQCPYKFKLTYIDKLKTLDEYDPQDALKLGLALHKGIETDVKTAIKEYYESYPIITDAHIEEAIKLEYWIPRVKELLPVGFNEIPIETEDYIGFVDYLVRLADGTYAIYDYKYSNNIDRYLESKQLHVYKHYVELKYKVKVSKLYFVFIPKIQIKMKKTETQYEFRRRLNDELATKDVTIREITFSKLKLLEYFKTIEKIESADNYPRNTTRLCDWCNYKGYCQDGDNLNIIEKKEEENIMLPTTKRVDITKDNYKKIWIYGQPFSGKTTLADQAPTPLNLNTDGNVKYVSMPRLAIKDEVTMNGRISKRKHAWEIFKEAIDDLEKGSDFKTIVVDLLEDTYEYCRLYMYDKLGITHESDDPFRAWDKVRIEFLSTYKRLLNLDYNIILISHEDTSKDLTKKSGDKITSITPNLNEKASKKIAGMVDIVARVVVNADTDERTLQFKNDEVVFGGGRLKGVSQTSVELSWDAIERVYGEAIKNTKTIRKEPTEHEKKVEEFKRQAKQDAEETTQTTPSEVVNVDVEVIDVPLRVEPVPPTDVTETPVRRTRRVRGE